MENFEISKLPSIVKGKKMPEVKDYNFNRTAGDFFDTFGEKRKKLGLFISKRKFIILIFVLVFAWCIIFFRIFYLQIIKGDDYKFIADGNRIRVKRIEPRRGIIYDTNFKPLLRNSAKFSLQVMPIDLPGDQEELLELEKKIQEKLNGEKINPSPNSKLGGGINLSDYISDDILENFQPRIVKESLEYEQAMNLMVLAQDLQGISVVIGRKREYPYQDYLSHVLGYMGGISEEEYKNLKKDGYYLDDKMGQSGLEAFYESILRGEFGKKKIEVNSLGKEIKELAREDSLEGRNLVLSIDVDLQIKTTDLLLSTLKRYNLKKGSVVALDPKDGSILALVSLPTFDNNMFSEKLSEETYQSIVQDPSRPMFFRAVLGEYPPGSTFKIIMAAAGLEEGIINESTSFLSTGGIWVGQWFFPDWKSGGHGLTNIKKALANSVNTFFYNIGGGYKEFLGLGLEKINFYAKQFGIGEKSGIDLLSEGSGFLPTKEWKNEVKNEPWYIGDTYHLSIGQGDILVTPIQVAMFTSVIANWGILYEPRLLEGFVEDKNVYYIQPVIKNKDFISEDNISIIRSGLRESVISGSARYLSTLPVTSAGKTGTAQFGSRDQTHAWFTGYAPNDNPEIVLTILIEEGGEGSSVAVPLARDILLWYFRDREHISEN